MGYNVNSVKIMCIFINFTGGMIFLKVTLNPDKDIVKAVKDGLKKTGGYCPCRREHSEENKCMCLEFRNQIKDENFEGFCHCMLYYKSK